MRNLILDIAKTIIKNQKLDLKLIILLDLYSEILKPMNLDITMLQIIH